SPHSSLFLYSHVPHSYLLSFPTRRSSDLPQDWLSPLNPRWDPSRRVATIILKGRRQYAEPEKPGDIHAQSSHRWQKVQASEKAQDRKSTRLNSSHLGISYAVFCLKKKKKK